MERMFGNIGNRPQNSHQTVSDNSNFSLSARDQPLRNIQTSPVMRTYDAVGYPQHDQFNPSNGVSNFDRPIAHERTTLNSDMPLTRELQTQSRKVNHLNRQSLIDGNKNYNSFVPQANQIEDNHMKAKQIAEVSKHGSKDLLSWGAIEGEMTFILHLIFQTIAFQKKN